MSPQRYERVSGNDEQDPEIVDTPISPPPSFRSRASSSTSRHDSVVNQTLVDTFDADGSDDEDNDGDDRQRLMRGTPTSSSPLDQNTNEVENVAATDSRPTVVMRRTTLLPAIVPPAASRVYGGGSGADGVFANLSAKPEAGEKLEEHPPTYEQAAADAAPPYWETTILAPGLGNPDDVYIDGLPVGSLFSFIWNAMISMSFQIVGFLLTYLLHTTHAAKNGSRVGLGVTLIQYGFYMKGSRVDPIDAQGNYATPSDPNAHDFDPDQVAAAAAAAAATATDSGSSGTGIVSSEFLAYALMIVGWFILIRSVSDFLKARRHEQLVLQSPERGLNVPIIATGEEAETVV